MYLVNEAIARAGYGSLSTFPPDVEYVDQVREAAAFARQHGYGLWSACQTDAEGDTNELAGQPPPTAVPVPPVQDAPAPTGGECDPSYPGVCIPPIAVSGDLDCGQIAFRRFEVIPPDPHGFDGDSDGVGCESG